MRRCVSSGRLPSTCMGNGLLGAFGQMLNSVASQVAPGLIKDGPTTGPTMAGVFVGPGSWRLDFIDGGVLVNCSFLSPNQEAYSVDFKGGRAVLTINTTPKPLVLTYHADNTITGPPGPVTIDGVVPGGYTAGSSTPGHTETSQTTTHETVNQSQTGNYGQSQLTYQGNGQYDAATTHTNSTYVPGTSTPGYTTSPLNAPPAPPSTSPPRAPASVSRPCRPIFSKACSAGIKGLRRLRASVCTAFTPLPQASASSSFRSQQFSAAVPTLRAPIPIRS